MNTSREHKQPIQVLKKPERSLRKVNFLTVSHILVHTLLFYLAVWLAVLVVVFKTYKCSLAYV